MSVEKARKIAAVRNQVRESNRLNDFFQSDRIEKLTDPTEHPRRQDDRFEWNQANTEDDSDDDAGREQGSDDAFEYWGAVFSELEADRDLPTNNVATTAIIHAHLDPEAEKAEKQRKFKKTTEEIVKQADAPIPRATQHQFPDYNDRDFLQEKVLKGLRGQKVTLVDLCSSSDESDVDPGSADADAASPEAE
ncbi:hypothetical protein BBJ29_010164 [Phytophthora kernoviae]|uniref:Uncharacterized protein n=1 Tax=Phytophthora kernoviae TaxID=325452 RepID=A0A3F2RJ58_9STRA|nr:hypothetical protein BBJ29_010164 [Phytophthora kernoviae]RLN56758.1 hypothetical protein BBP00_00007830 [Phytophthora kernoviae]